MPHEIFELRTRVRDLRRKAACVKTQQRGDIPRFKRPQNHLRQIESILPMSIGRQTIVLPVSDSREALRADPASHRQEIALLRSSDPNALLGRIALRLHNYAVVER